jgi:hypothetical protein
LTCTNAYFDLNGRQPSWKMTSTKILSLFCVDLNQMLNLILRDLLKTN